VIINQFECNADMDSLNRELEARNVTPALLASIMLHEVSVGTGTGALIAKFRVLYWDPTPNEV
jgi:hypothetical protein